MECLISDGRLQRRTDIVVILSVAKDLVISAYVRASVPRFLVPWNDMASQRDSS